MWYCFRVFNIVPVKMVGFVQLTCILFLLIVATVHSVLDRNRLEGYPTGFLSDCPGSTKEARISPRSLQNLKIVVLGEGNFLTANKTAYNYYQMRQLAEKTDFSKKIIIYMCGYLDSTSFFTSSMMGVVYKRLGYTVWMVEYVYFSAAAYPVAARFLRPVGKHLGEMLAELTRFGLNPKKLQLAGLSHGGQGVSFIAKNYKRLTGVKVSRITSLDPSGPCFRNLGPDEKLDKSDADFVDVIHTNIEGYGMATPMGHVDFYVNGGEYQPADMAVAPCTNLCSHAKSYVLWATAIMHPNCFIAIQCDSVQNARDKNCHDRVPRVTNVLGLNVDKNKQGIFYLPTYHYFPYCMGKTGLKKGTEVFEIEMGKFNAQDVMVL